MRKTTRYLIKKAIRDNVIIEKHTDEKAVDDFYKIYGETAKRENFVPFAKDFIKKEFEAFHKTGNAIFLFNPVAAALILFTKSTAFYHQGASIHTKIPVTYLLQWEAVRQAKRRGCQFYNFWGILQKGRTPKNWEGLTLFKTGFGGKQIDYLPTQDYIISPKYYLTYIYEKFLQWKRGV
jgi:lipid II:glycine glycyltransferase (peptidoglycan interpeptide bridge formation enzyme)